MMTTFHALFGSLLYGIVLARYLWWVTHAPDVRFADVRELSRHLSRVVYVLSYALIGVSEGMSVIGCLWRGGAMEFKARDDLEILFLTTITALVTVRLLGYRLWLRSVERAASVGR